MAVTINGSTGVQLDDNDKQQFGTDNDLDISFNGTNGWIDCNQGSLYIDTTANIVARVNNNEDAIKAIANGGVELYYNGVKKFDTTSDGTDLRGTVHRVEGVLRPYNANTWDIGTTSDRWRNIWMENDLYIADNGMAVFGTGEDFKIYHDGSNSFIDDTGTGNLVVRSSTIAFENAPGGGENLAKFIDGGAVKLYWDNNLKFETEPGGGKITGSLTETSDRALKKDIQPLSNSLTNLKQLNGYSFAWKDNDIKSLGLIAQEVETIYPDLVTGEEGDKGLKYSGLIAPLLEAIKELSAEVETLKTKVAALEAHTHE